MAKSGGLKDVEYAYVDTDRQPKLADRLSQGGAIPQLIRYQKTDDGWQRDLLVGTKSVKKVASFVGGKQVKPDQRESPSTGLTGWPKTVTGND